MKDDTGMLLFGLAVLIGLGFLFYKITATSKTSITEFVRDDAGRVTQIIDKQI